MSAREALFLASNYYRNAEFFLPHDDPRRTENYAKIQECFLNAARLLDAPPESVEIPYENGQSLPAYFFPARGGDRAPTLLAVGGLESIKEALFFMAARGVLERGISCCIMDGPGQGASLRERGLFTRHDFEVPVSAGVDYLITRPDIRSISEAIEEAAVPPSIRTLKKSIRGPGSRCPPGPQLRGLSGPQGGIL